MTFGQRLTQLRKARGWTQEDVSKMINVSRSAYAGYETNRRVPEYATLEKMADLFGESIDFLTGRDKLDVIDFSDESITERKMYYRGKELTVSQKTKVIQILREVIRIETQ